MIVTVWLEATALVVTVKVADVCPADTVTLAGTFALVLLLAKSTTTPPVGAAAVKVTIPVTGFPATCFAAEDYPGRLRSQLLAYVFMSSLWHEYE